MTMSLLVLAAMVAPPAPLKEPADMRGQETELAACMWEKAPKQARIAMRTEDQMKFFMALVKGGEACEFRSATVEIDTIRAALRATQPTKSKD